MIDIKRYPDPKEWVALSQRPSDDNQSITTSVMSIMKEVKERGDHALLDYTERFDGVSLSAGLTVTDDEKVRASNNLSSALKEAINQAHNNIKKFHAEQLSPITKIETMPGVFCWRETRAIDKVGLYVPGGSAPLFSTVLMLGVPAVIAGCKEIVICTPPQRDGSIHPATIYAASLVGVTTIYKIGGAQAIAAMTYGTETVPKVYKLFGPGNQYVTEAKMLAQREGVAIDMPAGPSEVLVIGDQISNPAYIASDLLAQLEHGPDSQAIFLTDCEEVAIKCREEFESQMNLLARRDVIAQSVVTSKIILLEDMEQCISFSNIYAPEHLIIATNEPYRLVRKVTNAGSVFVGQLSCESLGDYASGTNHTLPTSGYSKAFSGVSVDSFVKKITMQEVNRKGMLAIGPIVELMAEAEGLDAHKNAVSVRLKDLI